MGEMADASVGVKKKKVNTYLSLNGRKNIKYIL